MLCNICNYINAKFSVVHWTVLLLVTCHWFQNYLQTGSVCHRSSKYDTFSVISCNLPFFFSYNIAKLINIHILIKEFSRDPYSIGVQMIKIILPNVGDTPNKFSAISPHYFYLSMPDSLLKFQVSNFFPFFPKDIKIKFGCWLWVINSHCKFRSILAVHCQILF